MNKMLFTHLSFLLNILLFSIEIIRANNNHRDFQPKQQNRCYSCASDNLKENFLSRSRGPPRIKEPKLFDDMCNLDTWLIREKIVTECAGLCFKWQQIFNNSGLYTYSTIRGCWPEMFDTEKVKIQPTGSSSSSECNSSEIPLQDPRLDHSTIIEAHCWCQGDFCNSSERNTAKSWIIFSATVIQLAIFSVVSGANSNNKYASSISNIR